MNKDLYWLVLFMGLYFLSLTFIAWLNRTKSSNLLDYFSDSFHPIVLALTFAATLYSAFFMVGVPGFLFTHGIGAWPYIILGDVAGVLVLYLVGKQVIYLASNNGYEATSTFQLLGIKNDRTLALVFVLTVSAFMIPYMSLQILGIGKLLTSVSGGIISPMLSAGLVLIFIWIYSSIGGIRAIVFSDVIQGVILFSLMFGLGLLVLSKFGGPIGLINELNQTSAAHLTLPGPNGLFTFTTLLSFFFVIVLLPISQPQFFSRYILFSDKRNRRPLRKLKNVSLGMCIIFSIISLPIIFIGLGGAAAFSEIVKGDEVVTKILSEWTPVWLASLFSVAVLAAAMSTTDSILFSIAQMFSQDVLSADETDSSNEIKRLITARIFVLCIAAISFIFALVSSSPLILNLGKLAFSGCVIVVPFLLFGLFRKESLTVMRISLYVPVILFISLIILGHKKILGFDLSLWVALVGMVLAYIYSRYIACEL